MPQKKIKASDVIGNSYYIYTLTSSNNTPSLNGSINITCKVTDVYGQSVGGKSITLYQNSTSQGAKTTDSNGNASWNNISMTSAGLQVFRVENSKIEVFVDNKSDVGHTHSGYVSATKVTSWQSTPSNSNVPSEKLVKDSLDGKANSTHNHTVSNITDFPTSMTPSSHTHGNLQNDGQVGSTAQASKNVVTDSSGKITTEDKPTIPSPSSSAPLGLNPTNSGVVGTSTNYARADHKHSHTSFTADGTSGQTGYVKVFQMKVTSTYQDRPIHFHVLQRGAKTIANVTIKFKNVNGNDPDIDSIMHSGFDNEYYVYKESTSTWSFIALKTEAYDNIAILDLKTNNGAISFTPLNTHITTVPSGAIQSTHIVGDIPFGTDEGTVAEGNHTHTKSQITDFPTIPSKTSDLTNDSGFLTSHQSLSGYLRTSDVKDNLTSTDTNKPLSAKQGKELKTLVDGKQATLVSGTSIKTVNNESLLGSGNISISGGNNVDIVTSWESELSDNKVASEKLVKDSLDGKANSTHTHTKSQITDFAHNHDDRYYTETEVNTALSSKVSTDDIRLSDTRNPKSTKISAGSDLNTYTTTGFYYNNANSDCATITPLPQPNKAFFLQVEDWGTSNYTKQTITHYDPVKTYERIRNSGTWTDWYELQHNDGTGGENLLRTEPNNEGTSGVAYTITDETFHNDKVYYRNETSQDTTKYSGWTWAIPRTEFDYGDIFTLSFYAKGTSNAEIRTYFAGASGYISNRRISSNSDVDNNVSSYGDGATRFHLTSNWKKYYVTYRLHTTATTPTQNKSIHIRTFGASTDIELYISNVKLERGYYATDYDRHTRDNEPLYFPTMVSLPTTTTSGNTRKFIHPPYKFKNTPNWTIEGELKVTGNAVRFDLHKVGDTTAQNFIAIGKNTGGNLAYWWSTSSSTESSKTYDASHIAVDTWYPFRISRMGNNVLFMFNNTDKYELTTTYFNTIDEVEPTLYRWTTSGASVRNLKITPLEPVHPLSPSSSVCTNAQGIITTESKNNHNHSDTQLNWNGSATNNSVSPLLMAMDSEFGANRLAYFPSSRIKVEYSTDSGSTWTELTTGNYSEANKTKLVTTTSPYMYLGNGSTTNYSKNRLRITFDVGDMNVDSVLYLVTRKIALYTGTANATGFTCQLQTQTYAQYNTNVGTFSNYGSAFSLGGWSGWNTYPINFTLGGYSASNQTNSSSTRVKAIRLLFSQTGGTGNGIVSRVRLYGETAYKTASQYANNNHIYTIDENQNATFPSKIIKEGGTSSQFLMANGDVSDDKDILNMIDTALGHMITNWEDYE